jgi:hypothetical protein
MTEATKSHTRDRSDVVIWNNAVQHGRGRTMAEPASKR